MVGDYRVDRAVYEALPERALVLDRAERRVDLEARIVAAADDGVLVEREVMEGRVAGDVEPRALRVADELNRAGARDVREVDARACVADERDAARDVDFLGGSGDALKPRHGADASLVDLSALEEAYLLRVLHDARQTLAGVEQSEAQKVARRDGRTVVGEEYRSGFRHLFHLADFLAFALLADAARGQYARGLRRRAVAQHVLDERGLGDCGLRVRHRDERRKAARGSRHRSALEVLVPLEPRVAEVRVQVDEARRKQASVALDHLGVRALKARADFRDFAVLDEEAVVFYEFLAVEYLKAFEEKLFHYLAPPPQR